jgi:hypothetical protein
MKFVSLLILIPTLVFSIENSILPKVEQVEIVENLFSKKYSKNQLVEIAEALQFKEDRIRLVSYNILFSWNDHLFE